MHAEVGKGYVFQDSLCVPELNQFSKLKDFGGSFPTKDKMAHACVYRCPVPSRLPQRALPCIHINHRNQNSLRNTDSWVQGQGNKGAWRRHLYNCSANLRPSSSWDLRVGFHQAPGSPGYHPLGSSSVPAWGLLTRPMCAVPDVFSLCGAHPYARPGVAWRGTR